MIKPLVAAGLAVAALSVPANAAVLSTLEIIFDVTLIDNDSSSNFTSGDDYQVDLQGGFFQPNVSSVDDAEDPFFEPTISAFAFAPTPPTFGATVGNSTSGLTGTVFGFEASDNTGGSFTLGGFTFTFQGVEAASLDTEGALRGGEVEGFISISGNGFGTVSDASYRFAANSNSGAGTTGSLQIAVPADFTIPPAPIPVPASLPLLAAGLLGLGYVGSRRRKG
jgi:hypothetical protein